MASSQYGRKCREGALVDDISQSMRIALSARLLSQTLDGLHLQRWTTQQILFIPEGLPTCKYTSTLMFYDFV